MQAGVQDTGQHRGSAQARAVEGPNSTDECRTAQPLQGAADNLNLLTVLKPSSLQKSGLPAVSLQ
jgi:hypothetical protein